MDALSYRRSPTVTTLSEGIVTPQSSTTPHRMFLAATDILFRCIPCIPTILFFKPPPQPGNSMSCCIAQIKSSLALALVDFFPCAGRLVEEASGRLALDCNDAGVPFIESSIDVPFASLEADGFQHKPFFAHFLPNGGPLHARAGDALLSVQVTKFLGDEGFVLGIQFSHIVGDGFSFWQFMKSWGECSRGLPLSMCPIHMREALGPEKLILPVSPPGCDGANARSLTQGAKLEKPLDMSGIVCRDFHFSSEMVRKLKLMVVSTAPSGHAHAPPFSSLQALSAHIWRHVTKARENVETSIFFVPVNMRHRCVPPLPDAYFGNAIVNANTVALTQELQEESIGRTAMRIQELIQLTDDTSMKTFYGRVEMLSVQKLWEGSKFSMPSLAIAMSPRFPVYDVDFGWGPPLCVRCPIFCGDGEMIWFAGREGGGSVDVSLALTKFAMKRLEQDEDFLCF